MSKSKLSIAFFVLILSIAGFFIGLLLSRFFIPKNVGLAGGAMVVGYAMLGLIIALVGGLVVQRFMNRGQMRSVNIVGGIFCLVMIGWIAFNIYNQPGVEDVPYTPKPVTEAADAVSPPKNVVLPGGSGMAKPYFEKDHTFYLYELNGSEMTITDSVRFKNMEIDYAPSWFRPEHLKLDYQMLYMKVKARQQNFLEIVVNKKSGQSAWVKKEAVNFMSWPTFFKNVFSVEAINYADNPVRVAPRTDAAPFEEARSNDTLNVIKAEGDWLEVQVLDDDYNEKGTGWIRWQKENEILLTYNLLS